MAEPDFIPVNAAPDFIPAAKPLPNFPAPPGTPTIPKPIVPMSRVRTLTGAPYNPGPLESDIVGMERNALHQAADVSAPTIAHRIAQRTGLASPNSRLYPGEATLKQIPGEAVTSTVGLMGGAGDEPIPSESPAPRIAAPEAASAPKSAPSMVGRAGEVASRRAGRIPGVQAAKDVNYILRGPGETAEAAAPHPIVKPNTPPIPATNGVPWGTGGEGPIALRGRMIPAEAPELTTETRTLPGMVSREVIRTPRAEIARPAQIPPRSGLALPPGPEPVVEADPLLERLRDHAARIEATGHGDEPIPEPERTPLSTDLNQDLTPALKASLRRVMAAKRITRPRIPPVQ